MSIGGVGEEQYEMYEFSGKEGVCTFNVLWLVNEGGKGPLEMEKMLHVGEVGWLLAEEAELTGEGRSDTDQALKGFDSGALDLGKRQAVACDGFLELLGRDLAGL